METTTCSLPVDIKIASPCSAKWDDMPGGDTVRSCAHCARKVYNLSETPTAEAADLIRAAEGRLCVRFYRRADGTIMTKDCPTGLRAVRVRAARMIGVAFTTLLVWSGLNLSSRPRSEYPYLLRLLINNDEDVPLMGHVATEVPNAAPTPPEGTEPMPITGEMTTITTPMQMAPHEVVMGQPAYVRTDKPFLRGLEVDNTPREDPFAPEFKPKKRAVR